MGSNGSHLSPCFCLSQPTWGPISPGPSVRTGASFGWFWLQTINSGHGLPLRSCRSCAAFTAFILCPWALRCRPSGPVHRPSSSTWLQGHWIPLPVPLGPLWDCPDPKAWLQPPGPLTASCQVFSSTSVLTPDYGAWLRTKSQPSPSSPALLGVETTPAYSEAHGSLLRAQLCHYPLSAPPCCYWDGDELEDSFTTWLWLNYLLQTLSSSCFQAVVLQVSGLRWLLARGLL